MRRIPRHTWRAFTHGAAQLLGLAVLTALACLAFAAARDGHSLSLRELSQASVADSVRMSCADDVPLSGGDVQWCSDPSSPACRPAAPPAPRLELAGAPELVVLPTLELPAATFVWLPWPRPRAATLSSQTAVDRLDRPPRV